ncbi:T-related protein [Galendromus occidentalis]|uniref:T-related protein n=1 Tax=Galendromus occidentalis TaxID=34638 RepID=A0AAJ6QP10_9ACAR|nr:T-related protein [Galendromus occidentalis]
MCTPSPQVTLLDFELWLKFREVTNEMIVTKSGRRMFPVIRIQLSGLDPFGRYSVRLEIPQFGSSRYKFQGTEWVPSGKCESPSVQSGFVHQESPNSGSFWMKGPVAFNKVKLTNKNTSDSRYIVLNSLHLYEPRVIITAEESGNQWTFPMSETQFIAVTAYQNERVTSLKVRHNPFAKAFLDTRADHSGPGLPQTQSPFAQPMASLQSSDVHESASNPLPSTSSGGATDNRWVQHVYRSPSLDYWKNEAFRLSNSTINAQLPCSALAPPPESQAPMSAPPPMMGQTSAFLPSSSFGFPYIQFVDYWDPPPPTQDLEEL